MRRLQGELLMYGKPGARDDWAKSIEQYRRDQREAKNARFVFGCMLVGVLFFMPYIVAGWPA